MNEDSSPVRFNPSKNGYYRDDSKTKPSGTAGSKDFGRIMERDEKSGSSKKNIKADDEADEHEKIAISEENIAEQGPLSLFDISRAQQKKLAKPLAKGLEGASKAVSENGSLPSSKEVGKPKDTAEAIDADEETPTDPSHIAETEASNIKEILAKETLSAEVVKKEIATRPFDLLASASREFSSRLEKTSSQNEKSQSIFNREQPDLAAINPLAINTDTTIAMNADLKSDKPIAPVRPIQELINEMVKEVQSMEKDGRTDTTVTLKYPPIFEGAQLVVTSFNSARGEFNISFENLTQAAQQLISMQQNKESLLSALEQKGYHVHIVTASTIDEQRLFTANVEDPHPERDRNREGKHDQQNEQEE